MSNEDTIRDGIINHDRAKALADRLFEILMNMHYCHTAHIEIDLKVNEADSIVYNISEYSFPPKQTYKYN